LHESCTDARLRWSDGAPGSVWSQDMNRTCDLGIIKRHNVITRIIAG
jgi:hypothetical protein